MKCCHWQLFALSTLSFSVSIENFGFTVSTPFFSLKNVFLNCKMSKMHVNHSRVVVDLEKILQCGSAGSKTAKLDQTSWRHREWILRWTQSVTEDWVFSFCSRKKLFGLVKMNFGLVDVSYSLPFGKAVKLTFFAPWFSRHTSFGQALSSSNIFSGLSLWRDIYHT